ncbi:MAG: sulfite exporter TauE/SafE family protein [Gammaproteobacteria bacterium]|nr:MAG: sulfite exporter TauE/SafE family protein [Gammaproteobacteria bacterium]
MSLLLWPASLAIGIVLGMFGAGGGMITVPALIYLANMPVKQAIAVSLWVVAIVSFSALVQQKVWKQLQIRLLLTFGITGMAGSIAGSLFTRYLSEQFQLGLFALLIFLVTLWLSKVKLTNRVSVFRFIPASITGFLIGFLTGILGVGGGFLLVPALIYLGIGHFPTAVAHSLVLIICNAIAGGITYINTTEVPLDTALIVSAIAVVGSVIGNHFLKTLAGSQLQKIFSMMLVMIGGLMLWRAFTS